MTSETTVVPFTTKKLSRADILAATDAKTCEVNVPEWGGVVTLRSMSAKAALDFSEDVKKNNTLGIVRLMIKSMVDENGAFLFSEDDVPVLAEKSMSVITRLQDAALELNGLGEKAEKAKAALKNA